MIFGDLQSFHNGQVPKVEMPTVQTPKALNTQVPNGQVLLCSGAQWSSALWSDGHSSGAQNCPMLKLPWFGIRSDIGLQLIWELVWEFGWIWFGIGLGTGLKLIWELVWKWFRESRRAPRAQGTVADLNKVWKRGSGSPEIERERAPI